MGRGGEGENVVCFRSIVARSACEGSLLGGNKRKLGSRRDFGLNGLTVIGGGRILKYRLAMVIKDGWHIGRGHVWPVKTASVEHIASTTSDWDGKCPYSLPNRAVRSSTRGNVGVMSSIQITLVPLKTKRYDGDDDPVVGLTF